jgi:hypothetical protein
MQNLNIHLHSLTVFYYNIPSQRVNYFFRMRNLFAILIELRLYMNINTIKNENNESGFQRCR